MASDVESRLKDKIIAYEKKIETRLVQQRYKAIITALALVLVLCSLIGIVLLFPVIKKLLNKI